jgi:hypothetical protein
MNLRVAIPFDASLEVRAALDQVGRTEAVTFSPDSRRLALASLDRNSITIVGLYRLRSLAPKHRR